MVELYPEQEQAVQLFSAAIEQGITPGGIAWFDMGQGKTRIAVETWRRSKIQFLLISARRAAFSTWEEEIEKCGVNCIIREAGKVLDMGFEFSARFVVLQTPDSLHRLPAKMRFEDTLVVFDELYLFGNPRSQRSIRAQKITDKARFVLGLSATIMPAKDNTSVYGQARAVGLQQMVGGTLTDFRSTYQQNVFSPFVQSGQWINKPGSVKKLIERLSPFVAVHFPDKSHRNIRSQIIHVNPTKEQTKAISDLQRTWSLLGERFTYTLSIARKVQSISNGWVEPPGDDSQLQCFDCSKAERLTALVDEIMATGKKCVIWCAFRNDVEFLSMHLKHPVLTFVGQQIFDKAAWDSGKYQIVLATVANGSSVNHFGDVEIGIYYSLSYRWLELQQSQGRHERKNSSHAGAFYYFLLTRYTLDDNIYDTVTGSRDFEINALKIAVDLLLNKNQPQP